MILCVLYGGGGGGGATCGKEVLGSVPTVAAPLPTGWISVSIM